MQETWVPSPGGEDALEEGMATHSSVFAWTIPRDGGTWRATVRGVTESDMTKKLRAAQGSLQFQNFLCLSDRKSICPLTFQLS